MKVFLIVLAALFLVGQIRVGGLAEYSAEGFRAWVRAGALKIRVFPLNKKDKPARKKEKRAKPPKKKEEAPPSPKPLTEKAGGALDYARALLPVALDAVGTMYGKLRMDTLELELTVGAADPGLPCEGRPRQGAGGLRGRGDDRVRSGLPVHQDRPDPLAGRLFWM